jgi:hypothetical protein
MGESIAEMNASHLASRAATLSSAISAALAAKDGAQPPAPKGNPAPGAAPATAFAGATGAAVSQSTAPAPESPPGEQSSQSDEARDDQSTSSEPSSASQEEAPESSGSEALAPLQAAGQKKDLRALEKHLGLPEGHLGVQNHDYAAYRRRQDELAADRAKLDQGQQVLIERFGPHVKALQLANKGDLRAYADLLHLHTGVSVEDFVKYWSANVQQLPPEVAEYQAEKRRKLQQSSAPAPETKTEPQAVTTEQATAKADKYISEEAGSHPAFKLDGAKDGVRKLWLASYDKATKGFKLTPQQAANEFVKQRKAAYEREQWILSGKQPPAPPRTKTPARRGQGETQPRTEHLTREQLIERGAQEWRRQKARDGLR